jgi:hypothetical protein
VHEFYADAIPDWRSVFNLDHDDLVTSAWDPLDAAPSTSRYFPVDPKIREVEAAPLHPTHITGAAIATAHFDAMCEFLISVAGLSRQREITGGVRSAVFAGALGNPDLSLIEVGENDHVGLRRFSFRLLRETDLSGALAKLQANPSLRFVEDNERRAILLSDPDGFQVEFYWPRRSREVPSLAA